jgi:hypothetical protein
MRGDIGLTVAFSATRRPRRHVPAMILGLRSRNQGVDRDAIDWVCVCLSLGIFTVFMGPRAALIRIWSPDADI